MLNKFAKELRTENDGLRVIAHEIKEDTIGSNLKKFMSDEVDLGGDIGDIGFIVIGNKERQVQEFLGKIRANFRLVFQIPISIRFKRLT